MATETADVASIGRALELLESSRDIDTSFETADGNVISARESLGRSRDILSALGEEGRRHHPLEAGLRIELGLSPSFFRVQLCLARDDQSLERLRSLIDERVRVLPEEEVRKVWRLLCSEFQEDAESGRVAVHADLNALGAGFFDPVDMETMRKNIAAYAARLKPKLVRAMLDAGVQRIRSELPGVPQFLAYRHVQPLDIHERRILACILKIYRTWGKTHEDQFVSALGISQVHWSERQTQIDRVLGERGPPAPEDAAGNKAATLLLLILRRVIAHLEHWVSYESPIERALLYHKLGLKVGLPHDERRSGGSRRTGVATKAVPLSRRARHSRVRKAIRYTM
jgi:hypothetical protein